ncbi:MULTISPECIES: DUF7287 family protein [Halorussus]|uniref:DUF7287 family protein n=1 Tax=Halorussus TaxID=1070314 RepID=UPI00209C788C|nr:hypothetical protein [Halorussus vallis]USZ75548.1 hypothetical protein NGM07_19215 [Halorussus vallis]
MRGQTTIDFVIGVSVFLLAVSFVFAVVPGILEPLVGSAQEETVAVDRIASQLAEGTLGDPSTPYVLDVGCTTYFFGGPSESDCRFGSGSLHDRIGVADDTGVNVQLVGDTDDADQTPDVLCNDGSGTVDERDDVVAAGGSCTAFEAGDSPPAGSGSVMVARRFVTLDGIDAVLKVRVW